jgi:hypothetical protein
VCDYRGAREPDTRRSPLGRGCAASARRAPRHPPHRCDPNLEFPDGPTAFLQTLNVIVLIVWACFAVDYVARLLLSVQKGQVRSDTQVGPAHGPAAVAARRAAPAS